MKRSLFWKCVIAGSVMALSAILGELDCQARQSNVYTINVVGHLDVTDLYSGWDLDCAWTCNKWPDGCGWQQWTKSKAYAPRTATTADAGQAAGQTYSVFFFGSHSYRFWLPARTVVFIFATASLSTLWAVMTGAIWWINKRAPDEPDSTFAPDWSSRSAAGY